MAETVKKRPSASLAIVALVLSCLFFIPLAPLVGLILGIIALVKTARLGGSPRTIAIIAVCLGPIFTFFNVGMCSAIAIPAFMKYVRRSKTVEATMNTRRLADMTVSYWEQHGQAPPTSDWTPAESPCGQPGDKYAPNPAHWRASPWAELGFSVDDPHYYQYRVVRDPDGKLAVEAQGNLDCDDVLSLFRREVTADGVGPLQTRNDIE